MPKTIDLLPGKFVSVLGEPQLAPMQPPTYNGNMTTFLGNANNNFQYKVFEERNGKIQSLNQTLISQDIYDATQDNKDLQNTLRNTQFGPSTYQERYDLIQPWLQINYKKPVRPPQYSA